MLQTFTKNVLNVSEYYRQNNTWLFEGDPLHISII